MMIDVIEEMSLQRSMYHFYLWKEAQMLTHERSLHFGKTKPIAISDCDTGTHTMNEKREKESSIVDTVNENENAEPEITSKKESDTTSSALSGNDPKGNPLSSQLSKASVLEQSIIGLNGSANKEDGVYKMSAKYRRVLNILKEEFPTIDSGCPPVTLIPDVYTRYSMYPKLCRDYTLLKQQSSIAQEGRECNANENATNDGTPRAHKNSKKRKHSRATTVATIAAATEEEEEDPSYTSMNNCITKREDVPADVKEQFTAVQNEAKEHKKKIKILLQMMEEQTQEHEEQERRRALRLQKQRQLLEKRKRARLLATNSPAKSSDPISKNAKSSYSKSNNTKSNDTKSSNARRSSVTSTNGSDESDSDNDNEEDNFPVSFDERYELLKHFQEGHGHCRVTPTHNKRMNTWVTHLRSVYRKMQEEPKKTAIGPNGEPYEYESTYMGLTPERIQKLEEIGFEWVIKDTPALTWDERYEQLKEFKEKHGHCIVRRGYKENPQLGDWVHFQRFHYAKKMKVLTPERIAKMDALGFVWRLITPQKSVCWEVRLKQCLDFRRKHGHLIIPAVLAKCENGKMPSAEEKSFRSWAQKQRLEYRKYNQGLRSLLDGKRIKQLKDLEFSFDALPRGKKKRPDQNNNWIKETMTTIPDNNGQKISRTTAPRILLTNHTQNDESKAQNPSTNKGMSAVESLSGGDDYDDDDYDDDDGSSYVGENGNYGVR